MISMPHKHSFIKSDKWGYEVCTECGTYHSLELLPRKEIYEDKAYWGEDSGRSTLEQQLLNVTCIDECGISKVDRMLQFVPKKIGGRALEIACAPGRLLKMISEMGYECVGIEPSPKYIEYVGIQAPNCAIACGYFPDVVKGGKSEVFDLVVGMDVLEHIEYYETFISETHRILKPEGTAIFMSPIILNKDGFIRNGEFIPQEHAWIFTQKFIEPYLKSIFAEVNFHRWIVSHEIIVLRKHSLEYQEGERFDHDLCADYGIKNK